jgi:hypothetical protein
MRRQIRYLVPLAFVVGTLSGSAAQPEVRSDEDGVFAATLRQQIQELLDPYERGRGTVLCAAIDPGGAPQKPTPGVLELLVDEPQLRSAGACDRRSTGAVEVQTLRPAFIVTVGPIAWIAGDEAHVAVEIFRSARSGARRTYRVVKERTGWVSLGPILKDGPLSR